MEWFENLNPILQALIATIFTWGITSLGALIVCFFKEMNTKVLDTVLGFSAGVMMAAAFWSLLSPSLELSKELGYIEWLLPAIGFVFGGIFVLLSDKFLDKALKNKTSMRKSSLKRSILLVSAITVHNVPEVWQFGVAFGGVASGIPGMTVIGALMLAIGIGIQNLPEGAAVSLPLRSEGFSRTKAFLVGQASGIVEPVSAVIGVLIVVTIRSLLPFLLSFAAGAMMMVVARELLPESVKENKNLATFGFILGFILMMILDVALG